MSNKIIIIEDGIEHKVESIPGVKVVWLGEQGTLKIYAPFKFYSTTIQIGNASTCEIKGNANINNLLLRLASDLSVVNIGERFIINGGEFIMARGQQENHLIIGDNCLFSSSIFIQTSDGHAILSTDGNVLNNNVGGGVTIGNHVWLGYGVTVLKNAFIADNTIVAARGVVTKKFPVGNCILAGIPAKVIKTNVYWDIRAPQFIERKTKND